MADLSKFTENNEVDRQLRPERETRPQPEKEQRPDYFKDKSEWSGRTWGGR